MLKSGHLVLCRRELAGLHPARPSDGDPLAQQREPAGGERVALVQDLLGQRLLADLERSQADRLGGHATPRELDRLDDLDVLLLDSLRELKPLEQILKSV